MRHLALGVLLTAASFIHREARAQVEVRWGAPDDQPRRAVAFGLGSDVGMLGLRYVQFFPPSPLALWAAAGTDAAGAGCDLVLPHLHIRHPPSPAPDRYEAFVSLGLTTQYRWVSSAAGTWLVELGLRRWADASRRWFGEFAFGGNRHLWGGDPWAGSAGLAVRLQMGATF